MNGIKALRQIQMSREGLSATTDQGAPTTDNWTVWRGTGTIQDNRATTFPEEDVGNLAGLDRSYVAFTGGELVLDSVEATFEQLAHIFDAAFYKATPTSDTGSGWIREYTLPTTTPYTSTDLQTYSFKCGDNNEVEAAGFGFVREFNLSGAAGEAWKVSATYETREVTTDGDGFETVTIPTVEEILFTKTQLYIDDCTTDVASTEKAATLLGADLSVTTGWQAVHNAAGRTDFGYIKQVRPEIMLNMTFEHNGDASAEKAKWRAKTSRAIRLKVLGNALTSAGTHTYKTLIIDLCGKYESFDKLGEQNGNDIIACTFRARYSPAALRFVIVTLVNEVESY